MSRFDIPLVASGLTAYAIERQNGWERSRREGVPTWMEQRRFWTDAILQGMAKLDGQAPDPQLMARFDHELEQARGSAATVPASFQLQRDTVQALGSFLFALEATGDDRRRQVNVVRELLEDMASHLPWAHRSTDLDHVCDQAERALQRMTAQMPIRFTRILLGGDAGPHWASGYASGAVTDIESVKQTAIYQEAVRDFPDVKSWPALCAVYVGRNLSPALTPVNACDFDLEIMNRAGDQFLKEPGVRWTLESCQMTIPVELTETAPERIQAEEPRDEEASPLLRGERLLGPEDLTVFELYATEGSLITFCLDVLADERSVFGRQLSDEREGSYIMSYVVYDEDTGAVQDTMNVELRFPHDEKWFHCQLSPEVRVSIKEKLDAFCMEHYGEHLSEMPAHDREGPDLSQTGFSM